MVGNKTEFLWSRNLTDEAFQARPIINWDAIQWVKRPFELWIIQCGLALFALSESLLLTYIGYKVIFFYYFHFFSRTSEDA
jgi:potassium channel subfamily T protein 1